MADPAQATETKQAEPAQADAAQSQPQAQAPAPSGRTVKYNHKTVVVPDAEIDRYITKGMAASKLEEERAALKAERDAQAERLKIADTLLQIQRTYPERYTLMVAASQGEKLRRAQEDEDFSEDRPLTGRREGSTLPPEYEQRLATLEAGYQTTQATLHQRELQSQINAAIAAQPSLRDNPRLASSLRERIEDGLASGRYQSPDEAAMVLATEQIELTQAALEREHAAREERLKAAAPMSGAPAIQRPQIDKALLNRKALRDGSLSRAIGEAARKAGAAFSPPN